MKTSYLIMISLIIISITVPNSIFAQNASLQPSLEEQLKLAREKVGSVYYTPSTGVPCDMWHCPRTTFFYPSIILIAIISSISIFILLIKSRGSFKKIK